MSHLKSRENMLGCSDTGEPGLGKPLLGGSSRFYPVVTGVGDVELGEGSTDGGGRVCESSLAFLQKRP